MKLSLYEQETIILYNQAEATAEVYTHDLRLLEKLRRLAEKYPGVVAQLLRRRLCPPRSEGEDGALRRVRLRHLWRRYIRPRKVA